MRVYAKCKRSFLIRVALAIACSLVNDQVLAVSGDTTANQWPVFPRRNLQSLARAGYLRGVSSDDKRSISILAKNGLLPTYKSLYDEPDKDEHDADSSTEKRNIASIMRLRGYTDLKRNVQSLARDGYRFGRGQASQSNDKRNIAALARDGFIHKRAPILGNEYYYPFYQNPVPPLSEIDGPMDFNELYDYQQSINPDMLPPLSQVIKRSDVGESPRPGYDPSWNLKRGSVGLPAHGLYRPIYIDFNRNTRNKRSIYSIPDVLDHNNVDLPEDYDDESDDKRSVDNDGTRETFEKRHIGSLARMGLLPSFRFSGGRYSRSGRARLLMPSQELYRKHSPNENFGIGKYFTDTEVGSDASADDADVPAPAVPAGARAALRALSNELPGLPRPPRLNFADTAGNHRWQPQRDLPNFYYFRSLKVPNHSSGKRYLLQPAVDNVLLRKNYRNASLPSRRKNQ